MSLDHETSSPVLDPSEYFLKNVFVHTHIEKTGGTSFVKGLRPILGREHIYDMRTPVPRPNELTPAQRREIWLLTGHFYFDTEDRPINRDKRYFVCIRDPVDRFISFYNYIAQNTTHPSHNDFGVLDIEQAYHWLCKNRPNSISNRLSIMFGKRVPNTPPGAPGRVARPNILFRNPILSRFSITPVTFETARATMEERFALVIPMNRVDVAVRRIGAVFGVEVDDVSRENVGVKPITSVPEDVRRDLQERNAVDCKLIDYFESVFDLQVQNLPERLVR